MQSFIINSSNVVEPFLIDASGSDLFAKEYETVSFECIAGGLPLPTIKWIKDDLPIETKLTSRIDVEIEEVPSEQVGTKAIKSRLVISDIIHPSDSGSYHCTAINNVGFPFVLSTPFELTIEERKRLLAFKGSQCVVDGGN